MNVSFYVKNSLLFIICGSAFLAGCSKSSSPQAQSKTYCEKYVDYLGPEYEHGWVTVPEDYTKPAGRKIQVFYYRKRGLEGTPIAVFNGGPGASTSNTFGNLKSHQSLRTQWSKLPLVFIDQRGTGCSTLYPTAKDDPSFERLIQYSSKNIVRDSEEVRKKLIGNKPWKVFGQSYGGAIVHRYAMDFPKSLVSAHSHGYAIGFYGEDYLYYRIKSQNRVMAEYLKRYPDDRNDLDVLGKNLTTETCYKDSKWKNEYCGPTILHHMTSILGFSDRWNELHQWLSDFSTEENQLNHSALQDFVDQSVAPSFDDVDTDRTSSAMRVINFIDFNEQSLTYDLCHRLMDRIKQDGENPELWVIHECKPFLNQPPTEDEKKEESVWESFFEKHPHQTMSIEDFKRTLIENNWNGQFYLYSGELDSFVPMEIFKEEVQQLGPLIKYKHFDSSGHEGFLESLVWKNLAK